MFWEWGPFFVNNYITGSLLNVNRNVRVLSFQFFIEIQKLGSKFSEPYQMIIVVMQVSHSLCVKILE